ncbi:MAG: 16S rRNA (cytidine(1402)-2'-O)-methyltransferase [Thermoleophilia bacterium]
MPLVVCATPIGNLEDVTLRVLRELAEADVVLCEDTRRTRILLERHGIDATLVAYERHREARRVAGILPRLEAGERVALVSDAGLPGVNDPGARLIRAAIDAGVEVVVLPGASAVETALVASGLLGERYAFLGYAPRTPAGRAALWHELASASWPVVLFEAPGRVPETLASLAAVEPGRPVAVCRELTKRFEEIARGTAAEVAARFARPPKGEVTLVVGPGAAAPADERLAAGRAAVDDLVAAGAGRRQAAAVVGRLLGVGTNALYAGTRQP